MPTPSVPLSMLVARDVPYEWHDAVAIAAQLVEQLRADVGGAHKVMPGVDGISIESNGVLTMTLGPAGSMPAMPGAARILQQLLGGREQPTPLRLGLLRTASDELTIQLDEFAAELSRWERPNRQAKLVALYQRAVDHLGLAPPAIAPVDTSLISSAAARLKTVAVRNRPAGLKPPDTLSRREFAMLGTAGVVVFLAAAWIATGQPIPFVSRTTANEPARSVSPPAPAQTPDAVALPSQESAALDAAAPTPPDATPSQPASAESESRSSASPAATPDARAVTNARSSAASEPTSPATAPRVPSARDRAAAAIGDARDIPLSQPSTSPAPRDARRQEPSTPMPPRAGASGLSGVGEPIGIETGVSSVEYRTGDPGVVPPVPLARLPREPEPGTPASQLQVLELHVNADGTVETARFVDSQPSYRNRWWTSAAKSWRFRPALKDGRPVKYVLRIVIQDPGGA